MCRRGFAGQMVLSHDTACYFDWMEPKRLAAALPQWNYLHIGKEVLPYVRERGVTHEQITTMLLVEVPRQLFETAGDPLPFATHSTHIDCATSIPK
jgi:phosphotriesterase-related protein